MADRYIKTDTGRAEIQARVHAISRTARNLLLILDGSRDGNEWVGMVRGATSADLTTLFDAGLIALIPKATPVVNATPSAAESLAALAPLSYGELYELLPNLAKEQLGLMKGYRYALAIEKADGLPGLQKVAQDMLVEIDRVKGAAVARSVKRALLL